MIRANLLSSLEAVIRDLDIERGWCINAGKPQQMDLSMRVTQDEINAALRALERSIRKGERQVAEALAYRQEHPPMYGTSE